jgi:hypothetical protein
MKVFLAVLLLAASQWIHAGMTPLFDGHSLEGWQPQGDIAWAVADNMIVASGSGDGFLASIGDYGDFHLLVEFWVDATTNSGIFIRCRDRARIHPETCYELNIFDAHPQQEARTGAIVMRSMPPMASVETVGRWSTFEVTAKGTFIDVKVNGVTTARLDNADAAPGFIALQHWAQGTVKFRRIELSTF